MQRPRRTEHQKIAAIAHRLYQNRGGENQPHNPQQADEDWKKAKQIQRIPICRTLFHLNQPIVATERGLERLLVHLKRAALLEILGLLGNFGLVVAVLLYFGTEKQRRDIEVYTAWQTITNAYGQPGNGGRIRALEFLNASPGANWRRRTLPFCWRPQLICWFWEAESLQGVDVSGASLGSINLQKAVLWRANLQEAVLVEANLQEADLFEANLQEADLFEADLQEAVLWRANLQEAVLGWANLQEVVLGGANLQEAFLRGANLQEAFLGGVNLQEVDLVRANLQKAFLEGANLQEAFLEEANLQEANLREANLQEADLREANLQEADLREVDLQGADLRGGNLQEAILLATDLRGVQGMNIEQLDNQNPPYLCNVALPESIQNIDPDRDCAILPSVLVERSSDLSLERARQIVEEARQITWE